VFKRLENASRIHNSLSPVGVYLITLTVQSISARGALKNVVRICAGTGATNIVGFETEKAFL
jgi:hypothetical protein